MLPIAVLARCIVIGLTLVSVLCLVGLAILYVALSIEDGLIDCFVNGVAFGSVLVTLVVVSVVVVSMVTKAGSAEADDCEDEDDQGLHVCSSFPSMLNA